MPNKYFRLTSGNRLSQNEIKIIIRNFLKAVIFRVRNFLMPVASQWPYVKDSFHQRRFVFKLFSGYNFLITIIQR